MNEEYFSNDRINDFILSLSQNDNDFFELKKKAIKNEVPIIRNETKEFLIMILKILKPKKILEIGTAIGYSALIMKKYTVDSSIITIEDYKKRQIEAERNFKKYDKEKTITLIKDDATNFLKKNNEKEVFDFIFLDAAKGQYINWYEDIKRILKKDGVLIADNILKDNEIIEPKFLIKKRDRTIHKRMREFLYRIMHDEDVISKIFNIGDGISVTIKK